MATLTLVILCTVHFRAKNLIPANQPWTATGSFVRNSALPAAKFDLGISSREKQQVDFWTSSSGGELHSPVFNLPAILECFVAGYPGKPGLAIYLERTSDHLQFPLTIPGNSFPADLWRPFHWSVPSSLRGQLVQLVAINHAGSAEWIGVSTPRRFSYLALLHQQIPPSLSLMARTLFTFALFLLPGFGLAPILINRWPHLLPFSLIIIVTVSAALGYLSFYIFFFSTPAGKLFSLFIYLASLALLVIELRRRSPLGEIARKVAEPLTLTAATVVCYLCFTFLFATPAAVGAHYINGRFFSFLRPGDNVIPLIFAEKIYNRQPIRPFCCGDWLSSDRPPLETGIFLLQRPAPWVKNPNLDYELLATALQCLWICGVWSVLVSLGTPLLQIRRTLLFLIFSGVIFYNSVYTWPKFLAATFILFALSVLIRSLRAQRIPSRSQVALAGLCLGLALVAHPGSIYSLATLPILLLRFRHLLPLRKLLLAVPIVLAFVLPWTAYQKFADPPGDRLIKWHLAGHPQPDSLTAWQEVRATYTSHTPAQLLALRWGNMRYLAGEATALESARIYAKSEDARMVQHEWFLHSIGVLNVGWFAALFVILKKKAKPAIPFSGWLVLIVSINLLIWCCIEFGPKYTPLIHSSYADFLLLSMGLLGFILALPRAWIVLAFAIQLLNFLVVWVWSPPYSFAPLTGPFNMVVLQVPLLVFGGILSLLLVWHLFMPRSSEDLAPQSLPI